VTKASLVSLPQVQTTYAEHASPIQAVAWSPDSARLVSGDAGGVVKAWEAATGKTQATYMDDSRASVSALDWSSENLIAEGGRFNRIRLLEAAHLEVVQSWTLCGPSHRSGGSFYGRPSFATHAVAFSPDSKKLLSGGQDGQHLHLWETWDGRKLPLDPIDHIVNAVAWSPDGQRFAAAGDYGIFGIWAASGERLPVSFPQAAHLKSFFHALAWSPDGTHLALSGMNGECGVWHGGGEWVTHYQGHQGHVFSLAWKPQGEYIASASTDQTVQVWEARTGEHAATYQIPHGHHPLVSFSPDGKYLAVVIADQVIQIWRA
jgi:WD40 repeat protein